MYMYVYARPCACTASYNVIIMTWLTYYVSHASYGRVQTAPKVLHVCPRMQKFTPRNTATTRSTKTTIMTVHVNTIMQAAPSQRGIISTSEASNQLLFHSQKIFIEWIWWWINFLPQIVFTVQETAARTEAEQLRVSQSRSTETVDKGYSRDGSRTASRFAIQVNQDGRSNCSQLGSRRSPTKPCPRRGDGRRSNGQTRRRSASDSCRKGRWETWSCWQCGCFHPQLSWYSSSALIVLVGLFVWWDAVPTDFS